MSVVTHVRGRETGFWGVIMVCNCVCARLCSVAAALVWAVRSCVVGACGPAASDASDPAAAAAPCGGHRAAARGRPYRIEPAVFSRGSIICPYHFRVCYYSYSTVSVS